MRRSLFFDLDGTLTDPREGIVGCLRHALRELGVATPGDDEFAPLIGPPLHVSLQQLLAHDQTHLAPQALELYRERFKATGMFENQVYPGIVHSTYSERELTAFPQRGVLWGYGARRELVDAGADGLYDAVGDLVSDLAGPRERASVSK